MPKKNMKQCFPPLSSHGVLEGKEENPVVPVNQLRAKRQKQVGGVGSIRPNNHAQPEERWACNVSRAESQHGCSTREVLSNEGGWSERPTKKCCRPSTKRPQFYQRPIAGDRRRSKQSKARGTSPPQPRAGSFRAFCSLHPLPLPQTLEETHLDECKKA